MNALKSKDAAKYGWTLAKREQVLPAWHRRGRPVEMGDDQGQSIVQSAPCPLFSAMMYSRRV